MKSASAFSNIVDYNSGTAGQLSKGPVGVSVRSRYSHDTPLAGSAIYCQKAETLGGTSRPKCLLILRLIGATIDSSVARKGVNYRFL